MEKGNANLHFVDRYIGIPLVVFLGLFRWRKRKIANDFSPRRIAILNISSIGDTVLMSGPIQDLKKNYPLAEIVFFCGKTNFGLQRMLPDFSAVHKLPVTNVLSCLFLIRQQGQFDLMIDFGPWPRLNSILSSFFKSKIKIGFQSIGQYRHYVYDYPISHSDQKHELDNFRSLLSPLNIETKSDPFVVLPEKENESITGDYVLFHPWPGGYKSYMKEWSQDHWLELAKKMDVLGLKIYITGAEADAQSSAVLEAQSDGLMQSLAGKYNLQNTAILVKNAKLLVTVNTGILHIGAAVGVKMVALHGPTSVHRWGPVSQLAINVFPKSDQCGYLHFGFEYDKSTVDCMELISEEEVYQAVVDQLRN